MGRILTIEEVSEMVRLKKSTLYTYVAQRKIPYIKLDWKILFDEDEIEEWINSRRVAPLKKRAET